MKLGNRILIGSGCLALLLISWIVVIRAPSDAETQLALVEQAQALMADKIYIHAVPLLEEAAGYDAAHTSAAEAALKEAYLQLIDQQGYRRKFVALLEAQMSRKDATPELFIEAANFYLNESKLANTLTVLKQGIAKTGSADLIKLYEQNRYIYQLGRIAYENVTEICGTTIGVQLNGLWGLALSDGSLIINCEYEKISTYNRGRMVVQKNNEIYAIDSSGNRIALLKERATDFGNYVNDRIPLLIDGVWRRATGEFLLGSASFEQIGTYWDGYVAAKEGGKWGVVDLELNWLLAPEYDEIIMDELGRSCGQDAVFARKGNSIYLFVNGVQLDDTYEDAHPFGVEGYAAVKKHGKWGFIDTSGIVQIAYQFEDALSFGQHLAAVRQGESWGYISLFSEGRLVIEADFLQAKSFANGSAPVLTDRGWQFITLLEFKKGAGL